MRTSMSRRPNPSPRGALSLPVAAAALAMLLGSGTPAPAAQGDCGQPLSSGSGPTVTDCVAVLKAALGSFQCAICVCDVNGSGSLTALDALQCLKKSVGQNVALSCPSCTTTTTTTTTTKPKGDSSTSTTSTSTSSTTSTLPVLCVGQNDCLDLPEGFRCNPNTGTCEKPCTRNTQCKDFYVCDRPTGYCVEPN
jgi:hypothetical protein